MASERIVHGDVVSEHIVRLFDSPGSLAEALSSFVGDAVRQGATTLLVIRPEHWALTLDRLGANGHTVSRAFAQGRLMVLDAEQTLASCVRSGLPDSESFERTIGDLVRRLATPSTRLRIYGEMVDVLAAQADFRGARTLETFWNRLAAECSFTLLCGYSSVSFGHPRSSGALELICRAHTNVHTGPADHLADFLVRKAGGPPPASDPRPLIV
jgi:hypothetical protein